MKRSGFSMIELVFVIVILGVLAAVAVPRFVTTRTDAQVAMARSDIASTLKAIPARVFAENLDPTTTPPGFSNWGDWIIDTGGLDRGRWEVEAAKNGVQALGNIRVNADGNHQTGGCGVVIWIEDGNLHFDPVKNNNALNSNAGKPGMGGSTGTFCKSLAESYPSGSNRIIPLATTGAVKF